MRISLTGSLRLGLGIVALGVLSSGAWAQLTQDFGAPHGAPTQWHPDFNVVKPADIGLRAHTNIIGGILAEANAKPPNYRPVAA